MLLLVFTGCGGNDIAARASPAKLAALKKRIEEKKAAEEKAALDAKRAAEDAKLAKQKAQAAEHSKPKPAPAPAQAAPPPAPKPPPRPEALAAWKAEDYLSAKRDHDARLVAALEQLPEGLASEVLVPMLLRGESGKAQADRKLIQNAIKALVQHPNLGRPILDSILWGRFPTDDDLYALDCALEVLFASPDREAEAEVLQILRGEAGQQDTPAQIARKKKILATVAPRASGDFRRELARMTVATETPAALRQEYLHILSEPRVENLAAQVSLYSEPTLAAPARSSLEGILSQAARRALEQATGLVEPAREEPRSGNKPGAEAKTGRTIEAAFASDRARDSRLVAEVARDLWNEPFQAAMSQRLFRLESLDRLPGFVAMAAAFPTDTMRAQMQQLLSRNWQDGPKSLQGTVASFEPGFLVVIKTLPRYGSAWSPTSPRSGSERTSAMLDSREKAKLLQARQEIARVGSDWFRFSHNLSQTLIRRMEFASRGSSDAPVDADPDVVLECPIELHAGARVVARHHLIWPEEFDPAGTFRADGLEVHYVRIHETTRRIKSLVGYYRRKLNAPLEETSANEQALWLDSFGPGRDNEHRRSVDVIITKAKPMAFATPNEEEKISIDVLTVEIRNPCATQVARKGD